MKEDNFINIIKNTLPESSSYIGDDTAYIAEKDMILTQDTLIEDVHFRKATISPYNLGIKSIAVNLSDIAASGGIPAYILISLSLPENIQENFLEEFYKGVREICSKYNVIVVGGDLTRASKITISVAVVGFGSGVNPSKRSYAKVDDLVIVTGNFGSSRAGLWILEESLSSSETIRKIPKPVSEKFIKAHINPTPRLKEGRVIASSCGTTTAIMDTSDGLADALYKISLQSNVSMEINYKDIPYDDDLSIITKIANIDFCKWILYGGEDYELVATVSVECFKKILLEQIPVRIIGKVIPSINNSVFLKMADKIIEINSNSLDNELFSHFAAKRE